MNESEVVKEQGRFRLFELTAEGILVDDVGMEACPEVLVCCRKGTIEQNDMYIVRGDGRRIIRPMRDALPFDKAGHYDGAVAGVSDPIACRVGFERERKFIWSLLHTVEWPVIVLNTATRTVLFNLASEKLTGYAFEEIEGRPFWDVLLAPEARAEARSMFDGLADGRFPNTYENEWIAKDGVRRWMAWSNTAIFGAKGEVELLIGSGFDFTVRRRAEEALRKSAEYLRRHCGRLEKTAKRRTCELEEAATELARLEKESARLRQDLEHAARVSVMGELTTSLAHELNQPLTAIMTNATAAHRLLDGHAPDVAEARAALLDIVSNNRRASDVIRRIRAMSRKETVTVIAVDINDVVRDVIALLRSDLLIKGISVRLDLPEGLPCTQGDRVQIQQVILNLLSNAVEAMHGHPGARELAIRTAQTDPATVTVSVRDTGPGLTSDQLDHIFKPFFTTKDTGMGMGLAISRSIAEAHGGKLRAGNDAEGGAVFHFSLPVGEQRRP